MAVIKVEDDSDEESWSQSERSSEFSFNTSTGNMQRMTVNKDGRLLHHHIVVMTSLGVSLCRGVSLSCQS